MGYGGIIGQQFDGYTQNQTLTQAVAALYGLGTDAVPNDVFNILSQSAMYKTVMVPQQIGNLAEGQIIHLNENNSPVEFYVAKHNYESSLNGDGRTLVVRKDCYKNQVWDSGDVNNYSRSDINSWFNNTYKNMLDADIRELIGSTKINYTPGNNTTSVWTLELAIFALSVTELGLSEDNANTEGSALPIASTLQIAYRNGRATTQWTRSPYIINTDDAFWLNVDGDVYNSVCHNSHGARPAFTLPSTFVTDIEVQISGLYDTQDNLIMSIPSMGFSPASVVTGSYVGTGTGGSSSNPMTLQFPEPPKIVFVAANANSGYAIFINPITRASMINQGSVRWLDGTVWSGNSLSWYSTNAEYQLNLSGVEYNYYGLF